MKLQNLVAAAVVALAPSAPALAEGYLPLLYAHSYCDGRRMGLSREDSVRLGLQNARTPYGDYIMVTFQGQQVRSDILQAVNMTGDICPGL